MNSLTHLDLDILHKPQSDERGSGRTVRMLTEAIQNADFMPPGSVIFIVGATHNCGHWMMAKAEWVAQSLGFEFVRRKRPLEVEVNGRMLKFITPPTEPRTLGLNPDQTAIFWDHYALGIS